MPPAEAPRGPVHWDEAGRHRIDMAPFAGAWTDLGRAGGSVACGLQRAQLDAVSRSTPVHVHAAEEELYYILGGSGSSWQGGDAYAVGPGDCVACLPNGAPHTFIAGPSGLDLLAFSTRVDSETCRLPRAGVSWLGSQGWAETGGGAHPWAREVAAGELEVPTPSERLPSIVNLADVEPEAIGRGEEGSSWVDLGRAAGTRAHGLNHVSVEPGMLACPPHAHSLEEEVFVVLNGRGSAVLYDLTRPDAGPTEHPVRAGSVLVSVPGDRQAHTLRAGDEPLVYLAYGLRNSGDIAYYPRSNKINFRAFRLMARLEHLDYFDGEV